MFLVFLIFAMVIWGISWPVSKLISSETSFEMILFWRFFSTSIAYLPVLILRKESFRLNPKSIFFIFSGSILISIYNLFFFAGLKNGLPGIGGVITTGMNPLFNFLLVCILTQTLIPQKKVFGLFIGFIGGLIILEIWKYSFAEIFQGANIYFLLGSITWAFLSMVTSKSKDSISTISYSFYIHLFATPFFLLYAGQENIYSSVQLSKQFWLGLFYLSCISTVFGTTMYFLASAKLGSAQASSFIFLVPTVALLSSWVIFNEVPKISTLAGGSLAIFAVYFINKK